MMLLLLLSSPGGKLALPYLSVPACTKLAPPVVGAVVVVVVLVALGLPKAPTAAAPWLNLPSRSTAECGSLSMSFKLFDHAFRGSYLRASVNEGNKARVSEGWWERNKASVRARVRTARTRSCERGLPECGGAC